MPVEVGTCGKSEFHCLGKTEQTGTNWPRSARSVSSTFSDPGITLAIKKLLHPYVDLLLFRYIMDAQQIGMLIAHCAFRIQYVHM